MPVTAVDEDCHLVGAEHHVRCSAEIWERAGGHAVTQPLSMYQPPDQLLGLCVTAANRLHVATASCG